MPLVGGIKFSTNEKIKKTSERISSVYVYLLRRHGATVGTAMSFQSVVRKPISANPGLNVVQDFEFLCLKALPLLILRVNLIESSQSQIVK